LEARISLGFRYRAGGAQITLFQATIPPRPPADLTARQPRALSPSRRAQHRRPCAAKSAVGSPVGQGARVSVPRPRFLPSRGSGALRVPRGPQREASLAATNVPSSPPALANSRFPATKNSPDTRPKCAKNSSIKGQPSRACGETGTTIRAIDAFLTLAVYEVRPG